MTARKLSLISLFIAILFSAGCGYTNQGAKSGEQKARQANPADPIVLNGTEIAAHLENLAMQVPHVRNARCVVMGNTAVVGIDVDADLDRAKVGTIKYSVAETLRNDPYGVNSIITADMDLNQRLKEIRDSIMSGHPFSGFANEMADIVSRIIPQLPGDIVQSGDMIDNTMKPGQPQQQAPESAPNANGSGAQPQAQPQPQQPPTAR